MSLFPSSNYKNVKSQFRSTNKIVNITKVVTLVVTERIEDEYLLYDNLYNDVGDDIKNILDAFVAGSDELTQLIDYENYTILADNLHVHLNEDNKTLEKFRNILIDAIEGAKHCSNKILEQEYAYKKLLDAYNFVINGEKTLELMDTSSTIDMVAEIKPEIIEYVKRGYNIVDDDGKLVPLNMDILSQIRIDLNII